MAIDFMNPVFQRWLKDMQAAGVIPTELRRIIIDVKMDEVAKVYYETLADECMFNIELGVIVKRAKVEGVADYTKPGANPIAPDECAAEDAERPGQHRAPEAEEQKEAPGLVSLLNRVTNYDVVTPYFGRELEFIPDADRIQREIETTLDF